VTGVTGVPAQHGDRYALLFVCMGNICRSPLGEALFIHHARERGSLDRFDIDSCGTGHWHVGGGADPRSIAIGAKYGVDVPSIARQVDAGADFDRFDLLLPMDRSNRDDLIRTRTTGAATPVSNACTRCSTPRRRDCSTN